MKNKFLFAVMAAIILSVPQKTYSEIKASQSSASINIPENNISGRDYRVKILSEYLKDQNSPIASNASDFVKYADEYDLDWRLVAAISGVESTFGKRIPANSYNGWGWGVYADKVTRFASWDLGIKTVSQGIRERYMDQWGGKNIYEIGSRYASSPLWAQHVQVQLNRINAFALNNPQYALSISY